MPYRLLDHTADLAIEVEAEDLEGLFVEAARAMFNEIVGDLGSVRPAEERRFELREDTPEDLLVSWLSELLFLFEVEKMLFSEFEVEINDGTLKGRARGERYDRERHELRTGIKSVTYHMLEIRRSGDRYKVTIVFDI